MTKIKVLFFHPDNFLGPEMTVYTQIVRHLDRVRFIPYVAINSTADGVFDKGEEDGLNIRRRNLGQPWRLSLRARFNSLRYLPASMFSLIRYARRESIDVVHCSAVPRHGTLGMILARLTGAKLLLHYHVLPGRYAGVRRFLEHSVARRADGAVAVSSFLAQKVPRFGFSSDQVHVVLNGVDTNRFSPSVDGSAIRQEFGIEADAPLILQLGRIQQKKRQEDTVRAFAIARHKVPGLRCLLVGWNDDRYQGQFGSYKAELERISELERLGDSLIIAAPRPDAPQLIAAADIVVMPSLDEAFGLVIAEAMATGKPVIGADSGGIPEVIVDNLTGFLVPPRAPEALAEKIVLLAEDANLRAQMGRAARLRAEACLDEAHLAADLAPVYEALANRNSERDVRRLSMMRIQ